ncbi:hypothetical protein N7512_002385 [Penicillium capsulatum]|nr:hypothetical protein N7512_002385 [Penicillium capsulatum]
MAAVECFPMASRHHPHHPFNQPSRRSSSIGSNNPYARYMSPSPSVHSRRSVSEVSPLTSTPSIWWSGTAEHHPVEPRRKHSNSIPQRRRTRQTFSRHSQLVNPDIIDELDNVTPYSYHHEGPYDAVYPERNCISKHSPVEAVKDSNEAALRATPRHKIVDSLNSHRPLDGTAFYPPGVTDREGHTYDYEEGSNFMNEYGNFMRLPGQKFTDEDFKNDPFYNRPISNPFTQLRKKLSLRRNKRRSTA